MPANVLTGVIKITAEGVQQAFTTVQGGLTKTESALNKLAVKLQSGTNGFTILGQQAQRQGSTIGGLSGVLNTTAINFQKVAPAANQAGISLGNFTRQMVGANIIGQLFGNVIIKVAKGLFDAITGAGNLASATNLLAKAQREAAESSAKEVTSLQTLVSIAQDVSLKYTERKAAIDEINKAYPELNKNLTLENINTQAVTDSFNKLIQATIRRAEVEQLTKTIAALNLAVGDLKRDIPRASGAIRNAFLKGIEQGEGRVDALTESLKRLKIESLRTVGGLGAVGATIGGPSGEFQVSRIKKAIIKPDKVDFDFSLAQRGNRVPFDITGVFGGRAALNLDNIKLALLGTPKIPTFAEQVAKQIEKGLEALVIKPNIKIAVPPKALTDAAIAAKQLTDTFAAAVTSGIENAFASIGEALGESLSGKDFGKKLFGIMGDFLIQIGKAMIAFGGIKKIVEEVLKDFAIPAAVAIGIGVVAIAAGTALKNIKSAQPRALGGPVNAGGSFLVGERGPELFVPNTGGQIVPNNRLGGIGGGGGIQVQIAGEFVQRGQDLLAVITLANQSRNRLQ